MLERCMTTQRARDSLGQVQGAGKARGTRQQAKGRRIEFLKEAGIGKLLRFGALRLRHLQREHIETD